MPATQLERSIARALLTGECEAEAALGRLERMLGRSWPWLRPLAERYVAAFEGEAALRIDAVAEFLLRDESFQERRGRLRIAHWLTDDPPPMRPASAARNWEVPGIETIGRLAEFLQMEVKELEWFADLKTLNGKAAGGKLSHYHYKALPKSGGAIRLIEIPKARMKACQRRILSGILHHVPAHAAAHGFVKGRSIRSFAAPHGKQRVVLKMDLTNFFPSFSAARIRAMFGVLGYPEAVADHLAALCTNIGPREAGLLYTRRHLPQGAPTSPALANICSYRMDCRLAGLASAAGGTYTRYADDLAFSGDKAFERGVDGFSTHVAAIAMEEGFAVNHRKTRVMRQGVRQRLTGLTVNQGPNIVRPDFDNLKATLTNCTRFGLASQNREGHPDFLAQLTGRVTFVEAVNPARGKKLRMLLDKLL